MSNAPGQTGVFELVHSTEQSSNARACPGMLRVRAWDCLTHSHLCLWIFMSTYDVLGTLLHLLTFQNMACQSTLCTCIVSFWKKLPLSQERYSFWLLDAHSVFQNKCTMYYTNLFPCVTKARSHQSSGIWQIQNENRLYCVCRAVQDTEWPINLKIKKIYVVDFGKIITITYYSAFTTINNTYKQHELLMACMPWVFSLRQQKGSPIIFVKIAGAICNLETLLRT